MRMMSEPLTILVELCESIGFRSEVIGSLWSLCSRIDSNEQMYGNTRVGALEEGEGEGVTSCSGMWRFWRALVFS